MPDEEIDNITKIKLRQKETNALIRELIAELRESRNNKVKGLKHVFWLILGILFIYFAFLRNILSPSYLIGSIAIVMNLRFFSYRSAGTENVPLENRIKRWLRRSE